MRILITGATGMLGRALTQTLLARGDSVLAHSRIPQPRDIARHAHMTWTWGDPSDPKTFASPIKAVDAVINLAGAPIAQRWQPKAKKAILDSRIKTTHALVEAAAEAAAPIKTWLNASAVGFYGATSSQVCDESSPPGEGFLAEICQRWEIEAQRAQRLGARVCTIRLGVVLSQSGGMLPNLLGPMRAFFGGPLGDGEQWLSWIHIADAIRMFVWALDNGALNETLNAVAPNACRQKELMHKLGQIMRRPSWLRVPKMPLRWLLGTMAEEVLLGGQNVVPKRALSMGFGHEFPHLETALRDLLMRPQQP